MKLSKILNNINYVGKLKEKEITYITHDSRKVKEGTLFIALKGNRADGHDYIFEAIDKGAVAVLANGRAPATNIVPILQVGNPRKIMIGISMLECPNSCKDHANTLIVCKIKLDK